MKKTSILFLTIISLSCFGLGVNSAIGKNKIDNELAAESSDAIMNAQTNPKNVKWNPEHKPTEHDRGGLFIASNALPSSPAFKNKTQFAIN